MSAQLAPLFSSLVLTTDVYLVRELQEKTRPFKGEFRFATLSHGEKLAEAAAKISPDAILIDEAFVDPLNKGLIDKIRHVFGPALEKTPYFALTRERSVADLTSIVGNGFADVFTKPVDSSLFFQKIQLHFPNKRFLKENLLFSMNVSSQIGLAMLCELVSASEFGANLRVNRELRVGDLFTLHGAMFGPGGVECLAKVMSCLRREDASGSYDASIVFVGAHKDLLNAVRTWIKKEYVKNRESRSVQGG